MYCPGVIYRINYPRDDGRRRFCDPAKGLDVRTLENKKTSHFMLLGLLPLFLKNRLSPV